MRPAEHVLRRGNLVVVAREPVADESEERRLVGVRLVLEEVVRDELLHEPAQSSRIDELVLQLVDLIAHQMECLLGGDGRDVHATRRNRAFDERCVDGIAQIALRADLGEESPGQYGCRDSQRIVVAARCRRSGVVSDDVIGRQPLRLDHQGAPVVLRGRGRSPAVAAGRQLGESRPQERLESRSIDVAHDHEQHARLHELCREVRPQRRALQGGE